MPAKGRAQELFAMPRKDVPPIALAYASHMCQRYGGCGEVILTAFAHHAQIAEGLPCADNLYMVDDEARRDYAAVAARTVGWTADPPSWAPYVGVVCFVTTGDVVRVTIDMRPKYITSHAEVDSGRLRVSFHTQESEGEAQVKWPEEPGPWAQDPGGLPTLMIDLGRDISTYEVVACDHGRYSTRIVLAPRLADGAWEHATEVHPHGLTLTC
jgi:hypothetical protein